MEISVKGMDKTIESFLKYPRLLVSAVADALNHLGNRIRKDERMEIATVFDRPTPFTLNALEMLKATKTDLSTTVRLKVSPRLGERHFLVPQIKGGGRDLKRSERWLRGVGILPPGKFIAPGSGLALNQYGNITGPKMVQILSALKAFPETGYQMNITARSRKRNTKPRDFFVKRRAGVPYGVFEKRGKRVLPVLLFISRPSYRKRYDFHGVAAAAAYRNMNRYMREALQKAAAGK